MGIQLFFVDVGWEIFHGDSQGLERGVSGYQTVNRLVHRDGVNIVSKNGNLVQAFTIYWDYITNIMNLLLSAPHAATSQLMSTRERFHAVMNFQSFDRLPIIEWASWWDKTIDRWHGEGLPASLTDRYDLYKHFGQDVYYQEWISPERPGCPSPSHHGAPLISSMSDYEALLPHLYPTVDDLKPLWERWEAWSKKQKKDQAVLWISLDGFFWFPRKLFGIEPHLYAFYDEPELMHRINTDLAKWHLQIIRKICSISPPDFMTFAEDLSYNKGPMLSEEMFQEFLTPYYRQVIPELKENGVIPLVDSDGDVTTAAPWFEAAGIEGILPLERQAGVDIDLLRKNHPRMKFIGHFDKMTMTRGESAMRGEFERLLPAAAKGGFLISVDHQTPPGVSYQDYQLYLSLFREYASKAGKMS